MHPQNMHAQQQQLINGTWVVGNAEPFTKHDPVAGMLLWQGAAASSSQVGAAVEAARAAFPTWARTPFAERQALVERFAEVVTARREDLAIAIASETGKPLWEARTEAGAMIGKIALSIKAYHERTGEREKAVGSAKAVLRHRPHGVIDFKFALHPEVKSISTPYSNCGDQKGLVGMVEIVAG